MQAGNPNKSTPPKHQSARVVVGQNNAAAPLVNIPVHTVPLIPVDTVCSSTQGMEHLRVKAAHACKLLAPEQGGLACGELDFAARWTWFELGSEGTIRKMVVLE